MKKNTKRIHNLRGLLRGLLLGAVAILAVAFILATVPVYAQTPTPFTNGAALCSYNLTFHSRYCSGAPLYENGVQVGWIGVWFNLQPDNSFTSGEIIITHADGGSVTYKDFSGMFLGTIVGTNMYGVLSGDFNGGGSSVSETLDTQKGSCYRGTCLLRQRISSGSGVE